MEQDLKLLYPYSVKLSENAVSYEFLTENNWNRAKDFM